MNWGEHILGCSPKTAHGPQRYHPKAMPFHLGGPLATYVLVVACLFTYTQLNPERYLRLIGFKTKRRAGKGTAVAKARCPKQAKGSGGPCV
jgi:hypothetical protein